MVLIEHLELEQRRVLDQRLRSAGIFHARQLHDDLPKALLLDQWFGDAELINAVANGFERLIDRGLLDPLGLIGLQRKDEALVAR